MSQNHSGNYMDYMDGVPVKISEKYKPPPIITLPYGIIENTSKSVEIVESLNYDFSLENNVLKKLIEWQNARETEKKEKKHRLQLIEEARQRELDLKAATENEERLKQLSISEVSYPSTEEISEISPDDTEECKPHEQPNTSATYASDQNAHMSQQVSNSEGRAENTLPYGSCITNVYSSNKYLEMTKPDVVSDILKPTPVSPHKTCAPTNLLDDPDPIQQFQQSINSQSHQKPSYLRPSYMKNNLDNLTFSDFENDTSSPFDNMELKTINDLELLAQVLNSNQSIVNQTIQDESFGKQPLMNHSSNGLTTTQSYSSAHSTNPDIYSAKSTYCSTINNTQGVNTAMLPFTYAPGSVAVNNSYYDSGGSKISSFSNTGITNMGNYYAPDYGYSTFQQPANISTYNQSSEKIISHNGQSDRSADIGNDKYQRESGNAFNQSINNPYEYYNVNYPFYHNTSFNTYSPVNTNFIPSVEEKVEIREIKKTIGSRSRSVPDIVRELDEEVAEARQRARERSHNCSPALQPVPLKPQPGSSSQVDDLPVLSSSLQVMCKHISAMGFPLQRVARACDKIGSDDKKIVEYLLVMGQLMDLGFPENKVAEALLNNDCNRDKALDDLIS